MRRLSSDLRQAFRNIGTHVLSEGERPKASVPHYEVSPGNGQVVDPALPTYALVCIWFGKNARV